MVTPSLFLFDYSSREITRTDTRTEASARKYQAVQQRCDQILNYAALNPYPGVHICTSDFTNLIVIVVYEIDDVYTLTSF